MLLNVLYHTPGANSPPPLDSYRSIFSQDNAMPGTHSKCLYCWHTLHLGEFWTGFIDKGTTW